MRTIQRTPWFVLARHLRPEAGRLARLGLVVLVGAGLPLVGPQLMQRFIDGALARSATGTLEMLAVVYVAVAVLGQAVFVLQSYLASSAAWRITNRLRQAVAEHAVHLDLAFHQKHTPGEMIERVDGDMLGLSQAISGFASNAASSAIRLLGTLVAVYFVDLRVGLALTALVAVGGSSVLAAQRRVVPYATRNREATAQMFGSLEERLVAAEDIRANGAGRHVMRRFHEDSAHVFRTDLRWQQLGGGVIAGTQFLFALGSAGMIAIAVVLLGQHSLTVGAVVLLFQYSQMVRRPVEEIISQAKELHGAGAAVTRVGQLLALEHTVTESPEAIELPSTGPLSLELEGVSFGCGDDADVLHDIRLVIPAGASLGLVGRTGSGKSSIARLALRLYDPRQGSVRLGGLDLRDASIESLRRRAAMVTQEVHLFTASLRDNLTVFDAAIEDERVLSVIESVGLASWYEGLQGGLDAIIGPGGVGLSAGESQLIALARVFLHDPGLVVLDEPSSRLDAASEQLVRRATTRLLHGRTAIVIAHRLATLADIDEIAVISHGRIEAQGPAEEILPTLEVPA